jgi:hypothetical protein
MRCPCQTCVSAAIEKYKEIEKNSREAPKPDTFEEAAKKIPGYHEGCNYNAFDFCDKCNRFVNPTEPSQSDERDAEEYARPLRARGCVLNASDVQAAFSAGRKGMVPELFQSDEPKTLAGRTEADIRVLDKANLDLAMEVEQWKDLYHREKDRGATAWVQHLYEEKRSLAREVATLRSALNEGVHGERTATMRNAIDTAWRLIMALDGTSPQVDIGLARKTAEFWERKERQSRIPESEGT